MFNPKAHFRKVNALTPSHGKACTALDAVVDFLKKSSEGVYTLIYKVRPLPSSLKQKFPRQKIDTFAEGEIGY